MFDGRGERHRRRVASSATLTLGSTTVIGRSLSWGMLEVAIHRSMFMLSLLLYEENVCSLIRVEMLRSFPQLSRIASLSVLLAAGLVDWVYWSITPS